MRILERPIISLKWCTPNPEIEIEQAGRICWESWGRSDGTLKCAQDFIRRLRKVGHIDVLEEAEASFWIEGSRTLSHQIIRHRTQHHLQSSQRYIKASQIEIMIPPSIASDSIRRGVFIAAMENAFSDYKYLLDVGVRKEDARFVLPNATLTKLKAKANFANWRKFFELRSDTSAQWEIRMVSNSILEVLYGIAPSVFEDLAEKYLIKDYEYANVINEPEFGVPNDN